ncbi:single-stranded DNA-binding protein [Nonomuraea sp. NPDC050536]|uniref:single-stranded DNA-binding protein n=1 Tax=Nonomuraea sp. NPDC050536 TaxID=3364366 RepID=UPI0037C820D8
MTQMTIVGNLVDPPELRLTPSGQVVARFRVASTPRFQDKAGQWKDGETLFMTCTVWRKPAEYLAESGFERGQRLIVVGKLRYQVLRSRTCPQPPSRPVTHVRERRAVPPVSGARIFEPY